MKSSASSELVVLPMTKSFDNLLVWILTTPDQQENLELKEEVLFSDLTQKGVTSG